MANINDFGEKIGGARKDLWSARGLDVSDLDEMNAAERDKFVKKDNVWKRPDYQKLMDEGVSPRVAYFMKTVRDSLPTTPYIPRMAEPDEVAYAQDKYVDFIGRIRDAAMGIKTEQEIAGFFDRNFGRYITPTYPGSRYVSIDPEMRGLITSKVLSIQTMESLPRIDRAIRQKQFGFSDDQKILSEYRFYQYDGDHVKFEQDRDRMRLTITELGGFSYCYPKGELADPANWQKGTWFAVRRGTVIANNVTDIDALKNDIVAIEKASIDASKISGKSASKKKFIPPQLAHVRFDGADFRGGCHMQGQDYLDTFGFRGGEFGNWMSERDRQASLDMGYEALGAMAKALNIAPEDIALGGRMAIAFGARGQGAAAAHYEPEREVINLTKMHGAGSLAHEWGHGLDDIANKDAGGSLAASPRRGLTAIQKQLHEHMKYKEVTMSSEEVAAKHQAEVERMTPRVEQVIRSYVPSDARLTPEQIASRDKLIASVLSDSAISYGAYAFPGAACPSVEALSAFCKEATGRVIPKDAKKYICSSMASLNSTRERVANPEPATIRVATDYRKESEEFDKNFSKEAHGYWASECEMFARAFACYVHDKLNEAGIRCDYLVGHSEAGPVPHGDERKQLNADFDALIADFKERGLLHDYRDMEYHAPEKIAATGKEGINWNEVSLTEGAYGQMCLDDIIADATARASSGGRSRESPSLER